MPCTQASATRINQEVTSSKIIAGGSATAARAIDRAEPVPETNSIRYRSASCRQPSGERQE